MDNRNKYIGQLFDNRYYVKKLIGNGGMAYVLLADDRVLKKEVAIKVLKDNMLGDAQAIRRFINESKAVSMLSHPNIINVIDVSTSGDIKYIVMEFVDGITLKSYMDKNGIRPFEETESYAIQILSALSHAHSKGIIHRDIKPQNIMIDSTGVIKVADFGIAKLPDSETISLSDKAIGTVNYINPEQASGKAIDSRSDIYSLGIMLYEMTTGRVPFAADTPIGTAYLQIHEKPEKPSSFNPSIPKGLEQIILKAIKKNPENRFQSASEMENCIERIKANPQITFDFVFDEEAETKPFSDVTPKEIALSNPLNTASPLSGDINVRKSSDALIVNRVVTGKEIKQKKHIKRPVEIEYVYKKSRVSLLCVALGILAALCCVSLVAALYIFETYVLGTLSDNDSETITVKNYVNGVYSKELTDSLALEGYDVSVEWVPSSDFLANTVISQTPAAEQSVVVVKGKQSCKLTLLVSSGENLITLSSYTGLEYRAAKLKMDEIGLNTKVEKVVHSSVKEGYIISTYPEAGTRITADTAVIVYVSSGNGTSYVSVPDFRGMSSVQLELALIKYKLVLGHVDYAYSDTVQRGLIISQSIIPGTVVPSGLTAVDITVSLGQDSSEIPPEEPGTGTVTSGFEADPDTGYEG